MAYFHVFVREEGETSLRLLATDLPEDEIKRSIVQPYRRGRALVLGGTITPVAAIRELRICMTPLAFEQAYSAEHSAWSREMESFNREGDVVVLSAGPGYEDMADSFDNVTDRFLRGKGPGDAGARSLFAAFSNHPIVSTVVGGVLLAGAVFYLGWK